MTTYWMSAKLPRPESSVSRSAALGRWARTFWSRCPCTRSPTTRRTSTAIPQTTASTVTTPAPPPAVELLGDGPRGQPPRLHQPRQLPVEGQQGEERPEVRAELRILTAGDIRGDVGPQMLLERVRGGEGHALQRPVQRLEVQPVRRVRHRRGDQRRHLRVVPAESVVRGGEVLPGERGPGGVGVEQLVIVAVADLLRHQRPHVPPQVQRAALGEQRVHRGGTEVAGQRGARTLEPVAGFGVVRHPASRPDVQHGFTPRGNVAEGAVGAGAEPPAAPLREQRRQVDEGQPEAAQQDVLAGAQPGQVRVGGEHRREVETAVPAGEVGEHPVLGGRFGADVPLGEDHQVGGESRGAVREPHQLRAVRRAGDPGRRGAVPLDGHRRGKLGQHPAEHPVQVGALRPAGGEVGRVQRAQLGEHLRVGGLGVRGVAGAPAGELGRPLGQRRARPHRALDGGRLVGEHRDVLRHRVHPQQPGLLVPPYPPRPGRMRVDQMDVQRPCVVPEFGRVGGDALQQPGGARPRADDGQDRGCGRAAHRSPPVTGRASAAVARRSHSRSAVSRKRSRCSGVGGRARELPRA